MRQAVAAFISEELSRPSHSLTARRLTPVPATPASRFAGPITPSSARHFAPLFSSDDVEVLQLSPRPTVDMRGWTLYLDSEDAGPRLTADEELFLLVEADEMADVNAFISGHPQWWRTGVDAVKLEGVCRRVAWRVGPPFSVVLACSRADLEQVMDAYLSDLLFTDDPLVINAITVVNAVGRPVDLIRTDSTASLPAGPARRDPPFRPPPNVVVFDAGAPDSASGQAVVAALSRSLGADSYVLHRLAALEWRAGAWRGATALLVCLCERADAAEVAAMRQAVAEFAKAFRASALLLLPAGEELSEAEMEDVEEGWTQVELGEKALGKMLCLRDIAHLTTPSRLKALLKLVNIECNEEVEAEAKDQNETPLFVCTGRDCSGERFDRILNLFSVSGFQLQSGDTKPDVPNGRQLIRFSLSNAGYLGSKPSFRFEQFFSNEEEFRIPVILLHADVMPSSWTMISEIFGRLPPNSGLVISSFRQTSGTGRGSNAWISPIGQLQMSFHCSTVLSSPIGQCPSLLQHLVALMIAQSVEEETRGVLGGKSLGVRLKWPNDILLVRDGAQSKIGGVLTRASFKDNNIEFVVGVGVNVANSKPTTCIHDTMLLMEAKKDSLPTIEILMRRIIINMQKTLMDLESGALSLHELRRMYESLWVHRNQVVSVTQADGSTVSGCRIMGIDEFGFLLVKSPVGEKFSLHPDGNSFDLLENLIRPK